MKVTVIGASGGIGQPLSLLLKLSTQISELALVDMTNCRTPVRGVTADLAHINTSVQVKSYCTETDISQALSGSDIVVITAGCLALKPGMTRETLFESSAGMVRDLAHLCARHCPLAFVAIITNPINSMVPIFAETNGIDPKRVFGVTTLDRVRACTFVSQCVHASPTLVSVPVVGGHGGESILALLSQSSVPVPEECCVPIEQRITHGAFEVLDLKQGSATLSMAYAANEFIKTLINAKKGLVEDYSYVLDEGEYFAGLCVIGPEGLVKRKTVDVCNLSPYEQKRLVEAHAKCQADVDLARTIVY